MRTAHKVTRDMVEFLNASMVGLGSDYYFSRNARATLTYLRHYEGGRGGYSVPRAEVEDHLYFSHKTDLGTLINEAFGACIPTVTA